VVVVVVGQPALEAAAGSEHRRCPALYQWCEVLLGSQSLTA